MSDIDAPRRAWHVDARGRTCWREVSPGRAERVPPIDDPSLVRAGVRSVKTSADAVLLMVGLLRARCGFGHENAVAPCAFRSSERPRRRGRGRTWSSTDSDSSRIGASPPLRVTVKRACVCCDGRVGDCVAKSVRDQKTLLVRRVDEGDENLRRPGDRRYQTPNAAGESRATSTSAVTDAMTIGVIDALEAIDIDHQCRKRANLSARAIESSRSRGRGSVGVCRVRSKSFVACCRNVSKRRAFSIAAVAWAPTVSASLALLVLRGGDGVGL